MAAQISHPSERKAYLEALLNMMQSVHDPITTSQIQGTCIHLLCTLSNNDNLTALISHTLVAPAFWHQQPGISPSLTIMFIYQIVAARIYAGLAPAPPGSPAPQIKLQISFDKYIKIVMKALDGKSPFSFKAAPWQELLVMTGLLQGITMEEERQRKDVLSGAHYNQSLAASKASIENRLVRAANQSLYRPAQDGAAAMASIVLALAIARPMLSEASLKKLNTTALFPVVIAALGGPFGLQDSAYFRLINKDIQAASPTFSSGGPLHWPETSPSIATLKTLTSAPLLQNLGLWANLASFSAATAEPVKLLEAHVALEKITSSLRESWFSTLLSTLESHSVAARLSPEAAAGPVPLLIKTLQNLLFAISTILYSVVSRVVNNRERGLLVAEAESVAARTLRILRDLFFISQRDGNARFEIYRFTNLACIDIVAKTPGASEKFLNSIATPRFLNPGLAIPLDTKTRILDLFYLNIAEHLTLSMPPAAADQLILNPASRFLSHNAPPTPLIRELFEAAHAATLAVFSTPTHAELAVKLVPFYAAQLMNAFPTFISPRQFCLAIKTVVSILAPPAPASVIAPGMAEGIVEGLRFRATAPHVGRNILLPLAGEEVSSAGDQVTEQTGLILALISSLPNLPLENFREWLTATQEVILQVEDPNLQIDVAKRFRELVVSGELDVQRAQVAVEWWAMERPGVVRGGIDQPVPMIKGAADGNAVNARL